MKKIFLIISSIILFTFFYNSCTTLSSLTPMNIRYQAEQEKNNIRFEYNSTRTTNTESAYNDFLEKYPDSEYEADILERLELLKAQKLENEKKEITHAYNGVIRLNHEPAYNNFLEKYPDSEYEADILERLTILKLKRLAEEKEKFQNDYALTKNKDTESGYVDFLTKYPNTEYTEEINNKLLYFEANREKLELDRKHWEKAESENTITSYDNYLEKHLDGNYRDNAQNQILKLKKIEEEEKERLLWVKSDKYKRYETQLPINFLDSLFTIRNGVSDFGGSTIREFFFYKDFEPTATEDINGNTVNISTQLSNIKVNNNIVKFDINRLRNNEPVLGLSFKFTYLGSKTSILDSIKGKNYESNESEMFSTFGDKASILVMLSGWY